MSEIPYCILRPRQSENPSKSLRSGDETTDTHQIPTCREPPDHRGEVNTKMLHQATVKMIKDRAAKAKPLLGGIDKKIRNAAPPSALRQRQLLVEYKMFKSWTTT